MGRPKTRLVDREEVVVKSLDIIDRDGLDALSLRRLGNELGVTGAALYHHFADKEEILRGVVELVLSREVLPYFPDGTWEDYVEASVTRFRTALVAHPNAAPLMTPRGAHPPFYNLHREFVVTKMLEAGVPKRLCYPIIDSTESLVFGSVLTNPRQLPIQERLAMHGRSDQPNLQKVVRATAKAADRLFQLELRALLAGWRVLIEEA